MNQNTKHPKWMQRFSTDWLQEIGVEMNSDYFQDILRFIRDEKVKGKIIYPAAENVFNAFHFTPFKDVKVVILGQDPYHGYGQAHGLAFSVPEGTALPPSLKNIYKELEQDLGTDREKNGCLQDWATQGVLLLNTSLSVEDGKAGSHQGVGWEKFTDYVIHQISEKKEHVIFILWGNNAIKKETLIDKGKHFILKSVHPSPLSAFRGFFGSKPFSKANNILTDLGLKPINW